MNKEEEINDVYEQLLDEYKDLKEELSTVSNAKKKFAMDVHEVMKQEQSEKILEELHDVVDKINDDSSEDKTKLYERFYELLADFNEINQSSYGGRRKKNSKKNGKKNGKKNSKKNNKKNNKKTKRTMNKR